MTNFGTIESYDADTGTGTIAPEKGGDVLPFRKSAWQQRDREPAINQRYAYDVENSNSASCFAVNMTAHNASETLQEQASKQSG